MLLVALALVFFLRLEIVFSRVWIVAWYVSGLAVADLRAHRAGVDRAPHDRRAGGSTAAP